MGIAIAANRLVSTKGMAYQIWLDWRKKGVGSSDIAAACGLNPWRGPYELFLEKRGEWTPEFSDDAMERMDIGRVIESTIAELYAKRHPETRVEKRNFIYQHKNPQYRWALANIDRIIMEPTGEQKILEIKNVSERAFMSGDWKNGESIPPYYMLQVQHQLFVLNLDAAVLVALRGGNKIFEWSIVRDESLIQAIAKLGSEFWRCVETNQAPQVTETATEAIAAKFPPEKTTTETAEVPQILVDEFRSADAALELATKRLEAAKNAIKVSMGNASVGMVGDKKIAGWSVQKGRESFDTKAFKNECPDLAAKFVKQGEPIRVFRFNDR